MTDSTEHATPPKSTKSRISDSLVTAQIQTEPKFEFDFVLRDTTKSEFLDVVDFGCVAISVETDIRVDHEKYV